MGWLGLCAAHWLQGLTPFKAVVSDSTNKEETSTCIIVILSLTHTDAESEEGDWDDEEDEWGSD